METKAKRLFTALRFNNTTIEEIAHIQDQLKEIDSKAKYVKPTSNFHLTLYFIGMTDELKKVETGFKQACKIYRDTINKPINIKFTQLGKFRKRNGNVIWLGAEETDSMKELANLIPKELIAQGLNLKKSNFTAHITLARDFRGRLPEIEILPKNQKITEAALVWSHRNNNNILIYDNILKSALIN